MDLKKLGFSHIDLPCEEVSRRRSFGGFEIIGGVLGGECDNLFTPLVRM